MSRSWTISALIVAGFLAAWGCNQSPPAASLAPTQAKTLETRVAKLEQDLKAMESARDAARAQANAADDRWKAEVARANTIEKERDELRLNFKSKSAERDMLHSKLEGIQKLLKDALGQSESALGIPTTAPTAPVTTPVSAPVAPAATLGSDIKIPAPSGL